MANNPPKFFNKKESVMNSAEHFAPFAALNLAPIKAKLVHKESGEGWSLAYADAVEIEYRRFLFLVQKFPDEPLAPLFDVDVFWHYHILDTMKYATDCEQVFGYFLHHTPDSGLRREDDEATHQRSGARMHELYEATFGEPADIRPEESHSVAAPAQTAWCQPATPKTAWCQPATAKTAWCQPATAKTAWCQPATAKTAWCQPATEKTAWCQPATAKTAWCQPANGETAWSIGSHRPTAIASRPQA
jgi:hypothetical protein